MKTMKLYLFYFWQLQRFLAAAKIMMTKSPTNQPLWEYGKWRAEHSMENPIRWMNVRIK